MTKQEQLLQSLSEKLKAFSPKLELAYQEVTLTIGRDDVVQVLKTLRDQKLFAFDQLIDLCAVDYLLYGQSDWETDAATEKGFSRAVEPIKAIPDTSEHPRFAVVYHLLSTTKNQRIRVKVYLHESSLVLPSVHEIWAAANWFEREAYDLFGVLFDGHPDLRRILTDYGFIGHPFRKDFPVSGHVEMRYDATLGQVIYEPVEITPRVGVPKVIRHDNRYLNEKGVKA